MQELNETAHKILDVAERYTQTRGFNAFSYKDIQNEVNIKTSSIHYYFPTKQDLAMAMATRFNEQLKINLKESAEKYSSSIERLEVFNAAHVEIVAQDKFCLCGMLASDAHGLSEIVRSKLDEFFNIVETWLTDAFQLGKEQNKIKNNINARETASIYLATVEGGMLIARARKQPEYLANILTEALNQLKS